MTLGGLLCKLYWFGFETQEGNILVLVWLKKTKKPYTGLVGVEQMDWSLSVYPHHYLKDDFPHFPFFFLIRMVLFYLLKNFF